MKTGSPLSRALFFSSLVSGLVSFASPALAQWENTPTRTCVYQGSDGNLDVATIQGFECLMLNFLGTATTFIGLAAFVMFIVGAFLYLTSGSSPKGAEAGRQTMTYALIGIVVALGAAFILRLISGFTGVTGFLEFNLFLQE